MPPLVISARMPCCERSSANRSPVASSMSSLLGLGGRGRGRTLSLSEPLSSKLHGRDGRAGARGTTSTLAARTAVTDPKPQSPAPKPQSPAPKPSPALKMKVGIVGFGTFGQFLAARLIHAGHTVLAYNARGNYQAAADDLGATYFSDADDFCEHHPEIVILCTSILSTQTVVGNLPLQRLRRSTLFVDVLSVKTFPKMLLLETLPRECDLLCTHPMFGPNSGSGSWADLNFMFDRVRILPEEARHQRVEAFLSFFRDEGCRMVEMTCEEHDRQAASSQFLTHTVGRMLGAMELKKTAIDTKGYEALQQLVAQTTSDSFDLYYGLFLYNKNAIEELEKMEEAFDKVKKMLFARLHGIARAQIFPEGMMNDHAATAPLPALPPTLPPQPTPNSK